MPIHAKKEKPIEVDMSVAEATRPVKYVPKESKRKPFVPPDPRCEDCFYWRYIAEATNCGKCCHHLLRTGKRRNAISQTECGSFLDKQTAPKEKFMFKDVPMTQWSCPEMTDWKRQR